MSCGVGHRRGSDPALLWCRLAATAPTQLLAWEPPYAAGVGLKRQEKKIKIKKKMLSYPSYKDFFGASLHWTRLLMAAYTFANSQFITHTISHQSPNLYPLG